MKFITLLFVFTSTLGLTDKKKDKPVLIQPTKHVSTKVKEPSDIIYSASTNSFFIVSDNGNLYETDTEGKIIKEAGFKGIDFEGVTIYNDEIFVVNETMRKMHRFDRESLEMNRTFTQQYGGGRNKGYESIAFNVAKDRFVMLTEKEPTYIHEFDKDFNPIGEYLWTGSSDIAGATWHKESLWLLSDEDMLVFKLNPTDYSIIQTWKIPVLNPEGIAFMQDGTMVITADDLERIYYFPNPESL